MLTRTLLLYLLTFTFIRAVPSWQGNEALIGGMHTTVSFCLLAQSSLSCPSKKISMGVSCVSLGVCMVRMYRIFPNASQPWAWGSQLHWGSPMGSVQSCGVNVGIRGSSESAALGSEPPLKCSPLVAVSDEEKFGLQNRKVWNSSWLLDLDSTLFCEH